MKIILTIIFGCLFTLCFAPYHYFGLGFISLTGLLLILDKLQKGKQHFWYGFLFGFAHHVTGLYWISYSMLVEPDKFAWMIPFSASILPAYFALYIGLVCWITYRLRLRRIAKVLFFAGCWALAEMARGYVFTGFPWNLAGYALSSKLAIAQIASFIGSYGLSVIAIIVFCTPYMAVRFVMKNRSMKAVYRYSYALYYLMPTMFLLGYISVWGSDRIRDNSHKYENTSIRIVQPNIPQKEKFDSLRVADHLFKYYSLTLQESAKNDFVPDLIIWPEAAVNIDIEQEKTFLSEVTNIIPFKSYLLLGTIRREGWLINQKIFNSVQVINSLGEIERTYYDKFHLVPFGEYVPLRDYLPFVEKITQGIGDFNRGTGPKTLKIADIAPFSPLICYEAIFPSNVKNIYDTEKPKWILNVTNDAWFGNSSGPYQHLDSVRMRAIEEGLPVIRSANTGISAVINSVGTIENYISLNKAGIIDTKLPASIAKTFYGNYGNQVPLILALALIIISMTLKYLSRSWSKAL
jgi:apolipoprotein N-acyltransferase